MPGEACTVLFSASLVAGYLNNQKQLSVKPQETEEAGCKGTMSLSRWILHTRETAQNPPGPGKGNAPHPS